jgi:hypothetical protein
MSGRLVPETGSLLLCFVRDDYETRIELAPHPAGWQLISVSGSRDDGTRRHLIAPDRATLAAEIERLATALLAHGRRLVERRIGAELDPA